MLAQILLGQTLQLVTEKLYDEGCFDVQNNNFEEISSLFCPCLSEIDLGNVNTREA